MLSLVAALGWPHQAKRLLYNSLQLVPNILLGASNVSLGRGSDSLEAPWPDLVIGASRRSAPLARWIKRRSGGRSVLVHLLHAQAPLEHFDLVVTLPQYRLPERDNVMCVTGALNRMDPRRLDAAAREWKQRLERLPRPWIAVLVGGDSSAYRFEPGVAARLGREASELARREGGSLLVTTPPPSRRCSARSTFRSTAIAGSRTSRRIPISPIWRLRIASSSPSTVPRCRWRPVRPASQCRFSSGLAAVLPAAPDARSRAGADAWSIGGW
jgi:hypothetical protein